VGERNARGEPRLMRQREPTIDLHDADCELRSERFLKVAEPFLAQRVHSSVAVEVRVDQAEGGRVIEVDSCYLTSVHEASGL